MERINTLYSLASLSVLLFWAGLILLFFRIVSRFLPLLHLTRKTEIFIRRWLPFTELMAWLALAVAAANWYSSESMILTGLFILAGLVIIAWIAWYYLRDLIAGVTIHKEAFMRVGEIVSIGDAKGKVKRMGAQGLELETGREEVIFIPYHLIASHSVYKTRLDSDRRIHSFQITLPGEISVRAARNRVQRAAMLAPNVIAWENIDVRIGPKKESGRTIDVSLLLYDRERSDETEHFIKAELLK
jgi:small-conductance mechanosensitive channel